MDFDGSLAPIVERPEAARPLPEAAELLARLASRYARVVVVSGRPVSFLMEHLEAAGAGGVEFAGLYGMERCHRSSEGEVRVEQSPDAAHWRDRMTEVASYAESGAPAGVTVENKGLAVTIHFRRAPEEAGWVTGFAGETARRYGLIAHHGKMSVELRPPVATDKGTVIEDLSKGYDAVFFAGDDLGDVPAFEALGRLRGEGVATLSVAVAGEETPVEVVSAADLAVDGPHGLLDLLLELADG